MQGLWPPKQGEMKGTSRDTAIIVCITEVPAVVKACLCIAEDIADVPRGFMSQTVFYRLLVSAYQTLDRLSYAERFLPSVAMQLLMTRGVAADEPHEIAHQDAQTGLSLVLTHGQGELRASRPPEASRLLSYPPMTRGIFCDSAQIRPVVATPESPMTGATPKSSWNFEWFTKGGPSMHVQKGV